MGKTLSDWGGKCRCKRSDIKIITSHPTGTGMPLSPWGGGKGGGTGGGGKAVQKKPVEKLAENSKKATPLVLCPRWQGGPSSARRKEKGGERMEERFAAGVPNREADLRACRVLQSETGFAFGLVRKCSLRRKELSQEALKVQGMET